MATAAVSYMWPCNEKTVCFDCRALIFKSVRVCAQMGVCVRVRVPVALHCSPKGQVCMSPFSISTSVQTCL